MSSEEEDVLYCIPEYRERLDNNLMDLAEPLWPLQAWRVMAADVNCLAIDLHIHLAIVPGFVDLACFHPEVIDIAACFVVAEV